MPMIAAILKREINAKISLCFAQDSLGNINPNKSNNIGNLEALNTADLAVFFCRFRTLPNEQLKFITSYIGSGKPVAGFRTSTHTFLYKEEAMKYFNNEWAKKIFGQQWITHHGHFDDGKYPLTDVRVTEDHVITTGIKPFNAYSWLYHVDGGDWKLNPNAKPFMTGVALKTNHEHELDKFQISNPVAWTNSYDGSRGKAARVFFTTLGHPYDFKNENMRRLAVNGILWAMGKEASISPTLNVTPVTPYEPSNSGFGEKYIKGIKAIKSL
jgi:type 1 glutamine amidotransferase